MLLDLILSSLQGMLTTQHNNQSPKSSISNQDIKAQHQQYMIISMWLMSILCTTWKADESTACMDKWDDHTNFTNIKSRTFIVLATHVYALLQKAYVVTKWSWNILILYSVSNYSSLHVGYFHSWWFHSQDMSTEMCPAPHGLWYMDSHSILAAKTTCYVTINIAFNHQRRSKEQNQINELKLNQA